MKTVEKKGLQTMAKEVGLDLYSLPYTDARPERQEWLAQQPKNPPMVLPDPCNIYHTCCIVYEPKTFPFAGAAVV